MTNQKLLIAATLVGLSVASTARNGFADTCFVATATRANSATRGTVQLILSEDETEIVYHVVACGPCSKFTAIFKSGGGAVFILSTASPGEGVWTPTAQNVQDLKDGNLELWVYDLPCLNLAAIGQVLSEPCEPPH